MRVCVVPCLVLGGICAPFVPVLLCACVRGLVYGVGIAPFFRTLAGFQAAFVPVLLWSFVAMVFGVGVS